ncbi:hypothetical protein HGRIS_009672 [Hohenbuehelia grisea]|uniref:Uncharacterized protein n=1 Tax=Hohenbuehelia grisea TaxID=104357 RepID=A0ABR3J1V2_9AGAR
MSSMPPPPPPTKGKTPSPHAQWYADIVPAMVPIALIGSAIYLALQLAQVTLSQEKFVDEAEVRIAALEAEIRALEEQRQLASTSASAPLTKLPQDTSRASRWWWS